MEQSLILNIVVVIGAILMALFGLWIVYQRLKAKDQGFGSNTLRAFGAVLFLPTIVILAATTEFDGEALAALLGAVAGYLLSRGSDESGSRQTSQSQPKQQGDE